MLEGPQQWNWEKVHTLCVKILFRGHTSGNDAHQRPHLYKVNQLSLADMKICDAPYISNSMWRWRAKNVIIGSTGSSSKCVQHVRNSCIWAKNQWDLYCSLGKKWWTKMLFVTWDQSDGLKWYLAMCKQDVDATHFLTGTCGASSICTSKWCRS